MTGPATEATLERLLALGGRAGEGAERALAASRAGGRSGTRPGQGGDVFDLRPYEEGDDLRHVDAAATARSGRPQVRAFHEEVDRTTLLVADFRRPMLWGTRTRLRSVAAAERLAREGWRTVAEGGRVGAFAFTDREVAHVPPRARAAGMLAVAEALVRLHAAARAAPPAEVPPLDALVDQAARAAVPGASVLLASAFDEPGPGLRTALEALARKCVLHVLLIEDASEADPPDVAVPITLSDTIAWRRLERPATRERLAAWGFALEPQPASGWP